MSLYPELEFKPVDDTIDMETFNKYNSKQKKLFKIQSAIFGRDLVKGQVEKFKRTSENYNKIQDQRSNFFEDTQSAKQDFEESSCDEKSDIDYD